MDRQDTQDQHPLVLSEERQLRAVLACQGVAQRSLVLVLVIET
jgi:hypothetical protein